LCYYLTIRKNRDDRIATGQAVWTRVGFITCLTFPCPDRPDERQVKMDDILKLGHIDKAFFRDIARAVDGLVDNPVNKKHFSERLKTFRKKREQFYKAKTKRQEVIVNLKFQLSEEEHKKGLAGEELRPPKKGWLIGYRYVQKTSPLMKALSDANIDSHLLSRLRYSSPLLMEARSAANKALSELYAEPDLDECIKVFDIIKATRPDLADSNFDARNASPLMVIRAKIASALDLDAQQSWTTVYFWMPPLSFDTDSWLSYHYEPGKQGGSPRPGRPESKVDRIACQYALLSAIHDYGLEELAWDEWLTTTDDEQWAKPLWTKVSNSTVSPDDPGEIERKTRIEEALAKVKADLPTAKQNGAETQNNPQSKGRRQKYSDDDIKRAMELHDDEYAETKDNKAAWNKTSDTYRFPNAEAARRTVTRRMKKLR
jgi:hypothetical protein